MEGLTQDAGFSKSEAGRNHRRETHRAWRIKNRDRRNSYKRNWSKTHRKSVNETHRKWRIKNPQSSRISSASYRLRNKSKIAAWHHENYLRNKESITKRNKAYISLHPEVRRKSNLNWKRNNPEKWRAHMAVQRSRRKALKRGCPEASRAADELIKRWKMAPSFVCEWCGNNFPSSALTVDHIRPVSRGGKHTAENICPSCMSCNCKKHDKIARPWCYIWV